MVRNLTNFKQDTSTNATSKDKLELTANLETETNGLSLSTAPLVLSSSSSSSAATITPQAKQDSDLLMSNLSSSSSSSSSSDLYTYCPQTSINSNFCTYICIITDLTDPNNTCKRHVINLSSNLSIESLIQEAANYFSYDPSSFNLMWKTNNEEKKVPLFSLI